MKIGIDVSFAVGEKVGVGNFISNLVQHIAMLDSENEYILYPLFYYIRDPHFRKLDLVKQKNFVVAWNDISSWKIFSQWNDPTINKKDLLGDVDVIHSNTLCAPKDHPGKLISTIYDISFLLHPEFHVEANRIHCLNGTIESALYADKIIAISQNTRNDLMKYFNIPEEKISVVYPAASDIYRPITDKKVLDNIRKKYGLKKPYIFNVGSAEPRKNAQNLIIAYSKLSANIQKNLELVFAGGKGWLNSEITELVKKLGFNDNVKFLGYVEEDDLPSVYTAASAFVYPSFYEGFGLPVIEAMACGTPIITANNSSLKEIAEGAAILVDAGDPDALANRIEEILQDRQLRERLREKGLQRAAQFSWHKAALETIEIYTQLFSDGRKV